MLVQPLSGPSSESTMRPLALLVLAVPAGPPGPPAAREQGKDIAPPPGAPPTPRAPLPTAGHTALPYELRRKDGPSFRNTDPRKPQPKFHTDIERLKKGNV